MSKVPKKKESKEKTDSTSKANTGSKFGVNASQEEPILGQTKFQRGIPKLPVPLLPEWSDTELQQEKWDSGHKSKQEKGKSPNTSQHCFEDLDGRLELPRSIADKVTSWLKPSEWNTAEGNPVVVKCETTCDNPSNLLKNTSSAAKQSELINAIALCISILWHYHKINADNKEGIPLTSDVISSPKQEKDDKKGGKHERSKTNESLSNVSPIWMPWYHVWPKENAKSLMPVYNPSGKYCIKLFWMGCWRKVTVDDAMPFDTNGNCLLPTTSEKNELWPLLLAKGIIKLASLEYGGSCSQSEFGEFSIIHSLTGWYPQAINIKCLSNENLWALLHGHLQKWEIQRKGSFQCNSINNTNDETVDVDNKHKNNWLMIASNSCKDCSPESVSAIGHHTEAAMVLRQHGFEMGGSHIVKLDTIRDSPLKADDNDETIKRWKLIRQKRSRQAKRNTGPPAFEESHWAMCTSVGWSTQIFNNALKSTENVKRNINPLSSVNETDQQIDTEEVYQSEINNKEREKDSSDIIANTSDTLQSTDTSIEQNTETSLNVEDCQDQTVSDWMSLFTLKKLFNTIWVFHNPDASIHRKIIPDQKETKQTNAAETNKQDKNKKNTSHHGNQPTSAIGAANTPTRSDLFSKRLPAHLSSVYVFIDSLKQIELIICMEALTRWHDNKDVIDAYVTSIEDGLCHDPLYTKPIKTELTVEKHSWHDQKLTLPFFEMKTTSSSCGKIILPKGRHILKFSMNYNHGYSIELCSNTVFTVGDEDTIADIATQESCLYSEYATETIKNLLEVIKVMDVKESIYPIARLPLLDKHTNDISESGLLNLIFTAMKLELKSSLPDDKQSLFDISMCAWKFTKSLTSSRFNSAILFGNNEATIEDQINIDHEFIKEIIQIQATTRGWLTRRIMQSCHIGSSLNNTVTKYLQEIAVTIQENLETFAFSVLKTVLTIKPEIVQYLLFANDEAYKLCYTDYHGNHQEYQPNTSFVFAREIINIQDSNCGEAFSVQLIAPSIPWFRLIVVDNDTGIEMQQNASSSVVSVCLNKNNKNGYTIVSESRSGSLSIPSGKTRLRLMGVRQSLPKPDKKKLNTATQLSSKEIIGYYTPNKEHCILRYSINVTSEQFLSFQLATSDSNVVIEIQVLDGSNVLLRKTGKGTVTLASLLFEAEHSNSGISTRATSRTGSRQNSGKSMPKQSRAALKSVSERQTSKSVSSTSVSSDGTQDSDVIEQVTHSYIIQASVLHNTWPLTVEEWAFVIKNASSETGLEGSLDLAKAEKERHSSAGHRKKANKDAKESRSPSKVQQVPSQQDTMSFDWKRPHWVLNVTYDTNQTEPLIKRDCQRENEIIAMKAAWEAASPGRAAKAADMRESILSQLTLESNQNKISTPDAIERLDSDPFKQTPITPIHLDENNLKRKAIQSTALSAKERFEIYSMQRDTIDENRKRNIIINDAIKIKQHKHCQHLYAKMLEEIETQQRKRIEYGTVAEPEINPDADDDAKKSPSIKNRASPLHNQKSTTRQATKSPTSKKKAK